jgi:hypothetical protein
MEFSSTHNDAHWILTCVYGPCTAEGKVLFLNWLKEVQMPNDIDWLVLGDFNLIRKQEDRNMSGGNATKMMLFNEVISSLGLNEIVL